MQSCSFCPNSISPRIFFWFFTEKFQRNRKKRSQFEKGGMSLFIFTYSDWKVFVYHCNKCNFRQNGFRDRARPVTSLVRVSFDKVGIFMWFALNFAKERKTTWEIVCCWWPLESRVAKIIRCALEYLCISKVEKFVDKIRAEVSPRLILGLKFRITRNKTMA